MTTYPFKTATAEEAVACVTRGSRVFVGSGCAEPTVLVKALALREGVADVEVLQLMTMGNAPYIEAAAAGKFRTNAFFIGRNIRKAVAKAEADYTPIFLSEIPGIFRSRRLKVDVALISISEPDRHGYCSLGVSVDVVKAAVECARVVAAEVNPNMPRTHGAGFLHVQEIDHLVPVSEPILELPPPPPDAVTDRIGELCAGLVQDRATLQLGIGGIPNAVLANLGSKQDLGVHSEMFSDGIIDLIEGGVITGKHKTVHPRKVVTSFCMGTRRLYDFVDDNPFFEFLPTEFVNDPFVIAENDKMISINSALQVDLTGQVCADSIGTRFYSGIGGQVDFIRGASRSKEGRSIIALPSTAKGGTLSRIVGTLTDGAGVVTTRGDVDTIVTEYGIAELKGRTVRERTLALISVAHPDFRQELLAEARKRRFVTVDQVPWPEEGKPYPAEFETTATFDGTEIHFRPIRAADERLLREFFYSHSEETIYHRYRKPVRSLTHEQLQRLCNIDYDTEVALCGFVKDGGGERMVAVGRYLVDRASRFAEFYLTVHDDLQGKGVGSSLLAMLVETARGAGVKGFTATLLKDNLPMVRLLHRSGYAIQSALKEGLYKVVMPFGDTALT